jgi:hypothetical protein
LVTSLLPFTLQGAVRPNRTHVKQSPPRLRAMGPLGQRIRPSSSIISVADLVALRGIARRERTSCGEVKQKPFGGIARSFSDLRDERVQDSLHRGWSSKRRRLAFDREIYKQLPSLVTWRHPEVS